MCELRELNSLKSIAKLGEQECLSHLEKVRWNGEPVCPHCQNKERIYKTKAGRYKCSKCRKYFSVKVGTIFQDSKLLLTTWFSAIYLISAHKKGISSCQLARDLEITQKSAWYLLHRIRYAMQSPSFKEFLSNIVEVDETYVGGKEGNKHQSKRTEATQGRSTKTKTPVFGMLERDGELRVQQVPDAQRSTLQPLIKQNVAKGSTIMSDEWVGYNRLDKTFKHQIVKHKEGIYVVDNAHTNSIEGFWSLFKRGIYGIYHKISVKHLARYLTEFEYRYNSRKKKGGERFNDVLTACGKVLGYKKLIATLSPSTQSQEPRIGSQLEFDFDTLTP